jgi:hypothetical protein
MRVSVILHLLVALWALSPNHLSDATTTKPTSSRSPRCLHGLTPNRTHQIANKTPNRFSNTPHDILPKLLSSVPHGHYPLGVFLCTIRRGFSSPNSDQQLRPSPNQLMWFATVIGVLLHYRFPPDYHHDIADG